MCRFPLISRNRDGAALVVTLGLISLVTMILVAFVTATRLDRAATANYGQSIRSEQIAQGGLWLILGSLQQEIGKSGPPVSVGTNSIYVNITTANLLPERTGTSASMTNLIKISTNAPFFAAVTKSLRASSVNSTTVNSKTRAVRLDRWNRPCLYTFSSAATAPAWVYMARCGPTNGANLSFGPAGPTANNAAPENSNFILGRFAYAIYDEGNLIDITLAGHPSSGSDLSSVDMSRKGSLASAELSEIPGLTDQKAVDALVNWRNKASIASSYTNYLYNGAPTNGFLQVVPGDNTFIDRSDLISYAKSNGLTAALPYLTTFSREWNSPSIPAGASAGANPDFRKLIYNGKPLQRFALSRFQLLVGDPASLSSKNKADILTYFGLTPSSGASSTWRSWQYRSATIGTPQAAIDSGRAPDLFELLKAAIVSGSLGAYLQDNAVIRSSTSTTATTTPYPPEQNADQQVARLVANMIDQYGADNYPTTIQMGNNPVGNVVYGIKNLPYFSKFCLKAFYPSRTLNNTAGAQFHVYFELWNPHAGTPPTTGPSNIRIVVNPEATYAFEYVKYNPPSPTTYYSVYASTPNRSFPVTGISIGAPGGYSDPKVVINPADLTTYRPGMSTVSGVTGFNSFLLDVPERGMPATYNDPATGTLNFLRLTLSRVTFSLQYSDGNGTWRTYSTFAGHANDGGASGMQLTSIYSGDCTVLAPNVPANPALSLFNTRIDEPNWAMPKIDPRTFRFRTGWVVSPNPLPFNAAMVSGSDPGVLLGSGAAGDFPAPLNVGMLYKNYGTGSPILKDPDGTARKADGYLSTVAASANPMQSLPGGLAARPILLNRPFRSVGELGYVFRDTPWKSLNFFSTDSGDAALLDLFCLEESEITAAKVNLNTPHAVVLKALLKNGLRDENGNAASLSEADVTQIATDLLSKTQTTPFLNRSDLVAQFSTTTIGGAYSAIKTQREASIRALASVTQTRTWNLLIDVIGQSGRFSSSANGLEEFSVEGERRYWLHAAIDRITGQIIETQLEPISE